MYSTSVVVAHGNRPAISTIVKTVLSLAVHVASLKSWILKFTVQHALMIRTFPTQEVVTVPTAICVQTAVRLFMPI